MRRFTCPLLVAGLALAGSLSAETPNAGTKRKAAIVIASSSISAADADAAAAAVVNDQQNTPVPPEEPTPPNEEEPVPPTAEEISGRVESMGEAFVELKNTVDALNRMRLSGYIQPQYLHDEASVNALTSPTATRNRDQFSVRRARVKFTYQFSPTSRFVLQPDITTSGVTLKDGYVEYTEPWTPWKHTLTAGQFNWPFGFEIMYSSSDREMPERSRVVRTLFPGERDRGVQASGRGFGDRFIYQVALVNGTGTSQAFDFNKRKDLVGRVGFSLGVIDIGASGYTGTDLVASTPFPAGIEFDKKRYGLDFQLITPVPGLGVRGEYITGEERGADVEGWYAYLIQNIGTRHQLVFRADDYDPNTNVSNSAATRSTLTLGGSYIFHWDANSKVMLAYEHPELEATDPEDDVVTLRYQYKF